MKEQIIYFIKNKRILFLLVILSIAIILFNGITYRMPTILNLDYQYVNYFLNVLVNLSCGYITSLSLYLMISFIPEYRKSKNISSKLSTYFARLSGHLRALINVVFSCYEVHTIEEWNVFFNNIDEDAVNKLYTIDDTFESFDCDFNEDSLYYDKIVFYVDKINSSLTKIDSLLLYLNEEALSICTEIHDTFIFEDFRKLRPDEIEFLLFGKLVILNHISEKTHKIIHGENLYYC